MTRFEFGAMGAAEQQAWHVPASVHAPSPEPVSSPEPT